jgi:hypothetical protein
VVGRVLNWGGLVFGALMVTRYLRAFSILRWLLRRARHLAG